MDWGEDQVAGQQTREVFLAVEVESAGKDCWSFQKPCRAVLRRGRGRDYFGGKKFSASHRETTAITGSGIGADGTMIQEQARRPGEEERPRPPGGNV